MSQAQKVFESIKDRKYAVIPDEKGLKSKLDDILTGGLKNLHMVADFDHTLSRFSRNGERQPTIHSLVDRAEVVPEKIRQKLKDLFNEYYPIEQSMTMGHEEIWQEMLNWWTKAHNAIVEAGLTEADIPSIADGIRDKEYFRPGIEDMINICRKHQVHILVLSAGISDVIEAVFKKLDLWHPEVMRVVSNRMIFDKEQGGRLVEFGPLVHVYNKSEHALAATNLEGEETKNVILLGDSPHDLDMAKDEEHGAILKIAFLNKQVDARLEQYKSAGWDVILLEDPGLDIVVDVLKAVD